MGVELESAKRLNALKAKADAKTGETSDTLADAVDTLIAGYGQGGGQWYDFTVTLTTDLTDTAEFVSAFEAYLTDLENMKDMLVIVAQSSNYTPVSRSGVPVVAYINKDSRGMAEGGVVRYRASISYSSPVSLKSASALSAPAGMVFNVKAVRILV